MDSPESDLPGMHLPEEYVAPRLKQIINHVRHGGKVFITRDGQDVAVLSRVEEAPRREMKNLYGVFEGQIWMADDFDELGPEWDEYVK